MSFTSFTYLLPVTWELLSVLGHLHVTVHTLAIIENFA